MYKKDNLKNKKNKIRLPFEVIELKVDVDNITFSFDKKISVAVSLKVNKDNWTIKSLDRLESKFVTRKLTSKEFIQLNKKYYWLTADSSLEVIEIEPVFVPKESGKRILKKSMSFAYGGPGLVLLDIKVGKKKKFIHWFRPK